MSRVGNRGEDKGRSAGQMDGAHQTLGANAAPGSLLNAGSSLAASFHSSLRRTFDILELEHRLRRLRQSTLSFYIAIQ